MLCNSVFYVYHDVLCMHAVCIVAYLLLKFKSIFTNNTGDNTFHLDMVVKHGVGWKYWLSREASPDYTPSLNLNRPRQADTG